MLITSFKNLKNIAFGITLITLFLTGCHGSDQDSASQQKADTVQIQQAGTLDTLKRVVTTNDKQQIDTLIKKMLVWDDSGKSFPLVPVITDKKDSLVMSVDMAGLNENIKKLKATNFFSASFIENYRQIILTIDKKHKNNEFGEWLTGDLPPFRFANDVDPWCLCQDTPYNDPWNSIKTHVINLNTREGEMYWTWGKPESTPDSKLDDFKYRFNVEKENGQWRIAYLQGFDFTESTKKDGL